MPKIHYVGHKEDGETAFSDLTKIERWMPGSAHEIHDAAVAARLLQHPDVFSLEPPERTAPTQADLEAALAALPGTYTDADYVVTHMRRHFGELFTEADEAEVREVVKPPSAPAGEASPVLETAVGDASVDTIAPGGVIEPAAAQDPAAAAAPAPAPAKPGKTAAKSAAKTSGKRK